MIALEHGKAVVVFEPELGEFASEHLGRQWRVLSAPAMAGLLEMTFSAEWSAIAVWIDQRRHLPNALAIISGLRRYRPGMHLAAFAGPTLIPQEQEIRNAGSDAVLYVGASPDDWIWHTRRYFEAIGTTGVKKRRLS